MNYTCRNFINQKNEKVIFHEKLLLKKYKKPITVFVGTVCDRVATKDDDLIIEALS